ncbi:hypothetical protein QVD17_11971 [Tagetes erecta]|uniref:Retrotransposon gag domain-containing protein n=1 Tax=Tagetes erecta TaxID=13708 RepID=A0AAD8P1D0_TARER|nr:hypothetical protein QVD17_11971 [Tagetes erecta]
MAGRGGRNPGRGRGNINMTAAELATLIQDRVAEALAAHAQAQAAVNGGACTFTDFMDCKPRTFSGSEGATGLLRWIEKVESVFAMCNCPPNNHVKYATGTLDGAALTWWNIQVQRLGLANANALPWEEFKTLLRDEYCPRGEVQKLEGEFWNLKMKGSEIEAYTTRSHELAVLCPNMVNPAYKRIEKYIDGLAPQIQGLVMAANPESIQQAILLAHKLTDQAVAQGTLPARGATTTIVDKKRKWEESNSDKATSSDQPQPQSKRYESTRNYNQSSSSNQNQGGYAGKSPKCDKCNRHHFGQWHFKKYCPKLKKNDDGNDGNVARGRAFVIGSGFKD